MHIKIALTVLSVVVAVTCVWFATVLVLRFIDMTLAFRTTFALSCVLSRFSFNLMLTQAGWLNVTELTARRIKADSHIACRAHPVPLPCRAAKGLACVFPISREGRDVLWL